MRYSRFVRRIAITGKPLFRLFSTEDSDDGTLLDVSRRGPRLCIESLVSAGQKLMLMLDLPGTSRPWKCVSLRSSGARRHCRVEFLKVENDDRVSLDVFLASRSKLPAGRHKGVGNRFGRVMGERKRGILNFAARGGPLTF